MRGHQPLLVVEDDLALVLGPVLRIPATTSVLSGHPPGEYARAVDGSADVLRPTSLPFPLGYSRNFADEMNPPNGRRLLDAFLVTPKDWDVAGWRSAFFAARCDRLSAAIGRALVVAGQWQFECRDWL
jgi:hypothetical protein